MTKKKNKLMTFLFSLMPGAGEMYMGFMKMGISLMSLFLFLFGVAIMLQFSILMLVAVVVWFYSFFHVHNLAGTSDEKFETIEDCYLIPWAETFPKSSVLISKYRSYFAGALILLGIYMLWQTAMPFVNMILPGVLYSIINRLTYNLPKIIFSVVIIFIGINMIRGKRNQIKEETYGITDNDTKPE